MSSRFLDEMEKMNRELKVDKKIPQLHELSEYLVTRTGYTVKPVPGILDQREFLNSFAFKIFNSTQYLRNVKTPDYSPEPDIVH
jgi:phenylalanine-4-hydroxylase